MRLLGQQREVNRVGESRVQQFNRDSFGIGLQVVAGLVHLDEIPLVMLDAS